ncbi:DNA topoisomerase IV subunit A [Auritidibacter ignavus]|uniref:DNA gyrase/topoisomerase IV subunit A n=1 Tax=Auritidibacter ignavus TaxID=678932 RepID=UPI00244D6062|nr:DNA topoisomerase IV subunit A [Auritidibacter ignavus]WGH91506.1 DNA topoisomerase IV subunit A [Auritidibacter ignavus]
MAKKSTPRSTADSKLAPQTVPDQEQKIIDIDVSAEMEQSFLEYAYSVIYSRALPDARDGLKPVQRRILYMMSQMGLTPEKGHVKSARVVGEVMGKLHPHGDGAIYDAMVRLAQDFNMRLPLVDGHGNFGSVDDGPAASRYTEAKMTRAAVAMTADIGEDTVEFEPNYDNQIFQPSVLPAAFPNLLVNGASGIAVGVATNMPPHHLGEVIAAAQHLLAHPEADTAALMKFVPGPDLPSGGKIVGLEGIKEAYETGRGSFKMRASITVEQVSARRTGLVITALPYGVGPEKVIDKVKDAVNNKKVTGVADVVDLTDRHHGLRMVIELKSGFNPQAVLAQLYKHTPLEESFGINNVALVDGQPRTLGLKELLHVYVHHRLTVVRRRTEYRLGKRRDRLHLVQGLLLALVDIDEVIEIIRSCDDAATARSRLMMVFDLTEVQADHILQLRLRQLTKFSRIELESEQAELTAAIAELEAILASDDKLRETVSDELGQIAESFSDPRRTTLLKSEELAPVPSTAQAKKSPEKAASAMMIADDPCWVILSTSGQLVRTVDRTPLVAAGRRKRHDVFQSVVATTARGEVGAVTSTGRIIRFNTVDVPVLSQPTESPTMTDAVKVSQFLPLPDREDLVGLVPLNKVLALATRQGVIKRVRDEWPLNQDEFDAISLKTNDQVVAVAVADRDDDTIVLITAQAQLLRFEASKVRPQGRHAGGVAGIKLSEEDEVIALGVIPAVATEQAEVVTVTEAEEDLLGAVGSAKRSLLSQFPAKGRATRGVRAHRMLRGETGLKLAWAGSDPRGSTSGGTARNLPTEHSDRDASGVLLDSAVETVGTASSPVTVNSASAPSEPSDQQPEGLF